MKDESKDLLARAIANLKQRGASSAPPQELVKETLAQLAQVAGESEAANTEHGGGPAERPTRRLLWSATRLAAAAVLLLAAGYAFGRIAAPKPDIEELRAALLPSLAASLEPAIRARVVAETTRDCQQAMVAGYVRLRDELTEQYRADLNRLAVQTLTVSNTMTNQLLGQLVEAVKATQLQDRQWVAAALEQIEAKRSAENAAFGTALASLAAQTETEFQRTQDVVRLLANTRTDTSIPKQDKSDTMN